MKKEMIKKIILAVILIFLAWVLTALSGCVWLSYNPETNELLYIRAGDQKLSGVKAKSGETEIEIEAQESQADAIQKAFELGVKAGAAVVK